MFRTFWRDIYNTFDMRRKCFFFWLYFLIIFSSLESNASVSLLSQLFGQNKHKLIKCFWHLSEFYWRLYSLYTVFLLFWVMFSDLFNNVSKSMAYSVLWSHFNNSSPLFELNFWWLQLLIVIMRKSNANSGSLE